MRTIIPLRWVYVPGVLCLKSLYFGRFLSFVSVELGILLPVLLICFISISGFKRGDRDFVTSFSVEDLVANSPSLFFGECEA